MATISIIFLRINWPHLRVWTVKTNRDKVKNIWGGNASPCLWLNPPMVKSNHKIISRSCLMFWVEFLFIAKTRRTEKCEIYTLNFSWSLTYGEVVRIYHTEVVDDFTHLISDVYLQRIFNHYAATPHFAVKWYHSMRHIVLCHPLSLTVSHKSQSFCPRMCIAVKTAFVKSIHRHSDCS